MRMTLAYFSVKQHYLRRKKRKTEETKIIMKKYSNMRLVDSDGEYSANPSDYFMQNDNFVFKNLALAVTERKGEWSRTKIVKENPTKKDLINWNKRLKDFI